MKKTLLIAAVAMLSFPMVASAHPALSQFPTSTGRPTVSVPTANSGSVSSGGGCLPYWPGTWTHTPCWHDGQMIMKMLANLK